MPKEKLRGVSKPWITSFSARDLAERLRKLPSNKATGSDGIPNRVYAFLADIIAQPLKAIFERSIAEGVFPAKWKEGIAVPIPKTNPPQTDKVRMIILLPTPSKILEKLVLDSIREDIEPLFGDHQHAFRKNCSTSTALLRIIDTATQIYDNPEYSAFAVLSFDLSRAFDKVDHCTLLDKLLRHGLPESFIKWIGSYLADRTFRVKVEDSYSPRHTLQVGVPQGSVLGPALFCIMAGDFTCLNTNSTLTQYADDITIVTGFKTATASEIKAIICDEIDNFSTWCLVNKQHHNQDKSQLMLFHESRSYFTSLFPLK